MVAQSNNGNGVNKDSAEAVKWKWYRQAAEQGNKYAVEQLCKLAGQGSY